MFGQQKTAKVSNPETVLDRMWAIGGDTGYYAFLWKIRGMIDKAVGN